MPTSDLVRPPSCQKHLVELAALDLLVITDPDDYLSQGIYTPPMRMFNTRKELMKSAASVDLRKGETIVFELRESTEGERQAWFERLAKGTTWL